MYVPALFAMSEPERAAMLAGITVADLITPTSDGLQATFLPLLWDASVGEHGALLGHVARNNPHWQARPTAESMVIAHGPDAYVSPRFYPSKAEHGRVVPTWNYVTAHIYGELIVHDDVEWLDSLITRLTARHEDAQSARDGAPAWLPTDAPAAFLAGQLRAIVGVELRVTRVQAKAKLSQNRTAADQASVQAILAAGSPSEQATATAMPGAGSAS